MVVGTVESRLCDHIRVRRQKLQHEGIINRTFIIKLGEEGVVPEGRPALIHDLGLTLRIKILSELAHDTNDLAFPRL